MPRGRGEPRAPRYVLRCPEELGKERRWLLTPLRDSALLPPHLCLRREGSLFFLPLYEAGGGGGVCLSLDHGVISGSLRVKLSKPAGREMKVFDRIRGSEKSNELKGAGSCGRQ